MATATESDRRVTSAEAAEYLGYKPQTLALWRHKGIGPRYYKINGGRVLYRMSDLERWMEARAVEPSAEEQ